MGTEITFHRKFKDYTDCYTVVAGLPAIYDRRGRWATKDIDMILIMEARVKKVCSLYSGSLSGGGISLRLEKAVKESTFLQILNTFEIPYYDRTVLKRADYINYIPENHSDHIDENTSKFINFSTMTL